MVPQTSALNASVLTWWQSARGFAPPTSQATLLDRYKNIMFVYFLARSLRSKPAQSFSLQNRQILCG